MNRLIIVEGISGVGKSNLGQHLSMRFSEAGIPSRWYFELEPENPVIPEHHDERIIEGSIEKWRSFLDSSRARDETKIFDGRLLVINIVKALQSGLDSADIERRLTKLVGMVDSAGMHYVYLKPTSVEALFTNTLSTRACEEWYVEGSETAAFCRARGLRGLSAVVGFWKEVDAILDRLYRAVRSEKIAVEITLDDWGQKYASIEGFLGIDGATAISDEVPNAGDYVGKYVGVFQGSAAHMRIAGKGRHLQMTEHPWQMYRPVEQTWQLVQFGKDAFVAKGQPVQLAFRRDDSGAVRELIQLGMYEKPDQAGTSSGGEGVYLKEDVR